MSPFRTVRAPQGKREPYPMCSGSSALAALDTFIPDTPALLSFRVYYFLHRSSKSGRVIPWVQSLEIRGVGSAAAIGFVAQAAAAIQNSVGCKRS
ncbi:hypothetical protein MRX96_002709 [Rhipicephalus microplus]